MAPVSSLQSEDGRRLLDIMDSLRLLPSISHEIDLPRIVVVGQQSSGKSSVLKALSNIDLPTNDGLCTHFATEIICRREARESRKAQIVPAGLISDQYRERMEEFAARWSQIPIDQNVSKIVEDATQTMGLDDHRRISQDKLRLEFCGPTQDHISLIDLPGLFAKSDPEQRKEDKDFVDDMVRYYTASSQTIILAVVSGHIDTQVQRGFEFFEPCSNRTLGVITAPDLIESGTARARSFVRLVANQSWKAGHGWHVLRNLSHSEEQQKLDRNEVERSFFKSQSALSGSIWASVPTARCGIENLKTNLGSLLQNHISAGLPSIRQQLRQAQSICEQELLLLGDERATTEQQRDYLSDKSESLHRLTIKQLHGRSGEHSLRSKIRNANDSFADRMTRFGASWTFVSEVDKAAFDTANLGVNGPVPITEEEWMSLMLAEISNSRGRELDGTIDPFWVGRMFLRQNRKWEQMAYSYADEAFGIVEEYFAQAIDTVVGLENAARFIDYVVEPDLRRRNELLKIKVQELLTPYSTEYVKTLSKSYQSRSEDLSRILKDETSKDAQAYNGIVRCTAAMLDYYGHALSVFLDNIESLAIENVLLDGLEDMMTVTKAHKMRENELAALASESQETTNKRRALTARLKEYEQASKMVSRYLLRSHRLTHSGDREVNGIYNTDTVARIAARSKVTSTPGIGGMGGYNYGQGRLVTPEDPYTAEAAQHLTVSNTKLSSSRSPVTEVSTPGRRSRVIKHTGLSPGSSTPSKDSAEDEI